ncbi:MAG: DUF3185 family protein [Bdellovibrionales bacterium]|nr:DUF3185 family protein [Bdellovibrionales bacterium]
MNMNQVLGIAFIVVGGLLLYFGFRAEDSFSSSVSKFFSGNPTDKTLWLFVGGAASIIAGILVTAKKS